MFFQQTNKEPALSRFTLYKMCNDLVTALLITTHFSITFRFFILSSCSLKFLCEPHFLLKDKNNRHWTNIAACYYQIFQFGSLLRISICSFVVYPVPLSKLVVGSYYCADSLVGSDVWGSICKTGVSPERDLMIFATEGRKNRDCLYICVSVLIKLSLLLYVCMSFHIAVLVISVSTHCSAILLCTVGINLSCSVFKLVCMSSYFYFCEMWNYCAYKNCVIKFI